MNPEKIQIITCADKKYYHLISGFEENILKVFGEYPIIVDIGMTAEQVKTIRSPIITCIPSSNIADSDENGFIRATHKAEAIATVMREYNCDLLYLDCDMVITKSFSFDIFHGCDIGVTRRHRRERRWDKDGINGNLNSGFLYFKNHQKIHQFLDTWHRKCLETNLSDQRVISDMLSDFDLRGELGVIEHDGLKVLKLSANLYNDVAIRTGYIYHIKGGGRDPRLIKRWRKLNWQARNIPWFLRLRAALFRLTPLED